MPIDVDRDDLPGPGRTPDQGWPPDKDVRYMSALAEEWMAQREDEGPRPKAADTRFRHSDAGGCARAIAYAALDAPVSNPVDMAGVQVMEQGTVFHDLLQARLLAKFGVTPEVTVRIDGFDGSGHADGVLDEMSGMDLAQRLRTVFEYKFTGGFAFKMAVGERGVPKGPRWTAVVQGSLNALGLDADYLVLGMGSFEAISKQAADRKHLDDVQRFCAEWTLTREQFEPIARREIERVSGILRLLDEGMLPKRTIPDPELPARNLITDPMRGTWVETGPGDVMVNAGSTWQCAYCRYQTDCAKTEPGRVPVTIERG